MLSFLKYERESAYIKLGSYPVGKKLNQGDMIQNGMIYKRREFNSLTKRGCG